MTVGQEADAKGDVLRPMKLALYHHHQDGILLLVLTLQVPDALPASAFDRQHPERAKQHHG